jgi:glycosyltransferase involved in cell wall biosynthesis
MLYMRRMRMPDDRNFTGVLSINAEPMRDTAERRRIASDKWPKQFIYVGRYVREKGFDLLLKGYQRYRVNQSDPWGLTCCGTGELATLAEGVKGVKDVGFIQPNDLPSHLLQASVLVLCSRSEPWGMVLAEACTAGMPVIATHVCGAAPELLRDLDNARVIPPGDPAAIGDAMSWMHGKSEHFVRMGKYSEHLAMPYSAEAWADRLMKIIELRRTRRSIGGADT